MGTDRRAAGGLTPGPRRGARAGSPQSRPATGRARRPRAGNAQRGGLRRAWGRGLPGCCREPERERAKVPSLTRFLRGPSPLPRRGPRRGSPWPCAACACSACPAECGETRASGLTGAPAPQPRRDSAAAGTFGPESSVAWGAPAEGTGGCWNWEERTVV